MPSITIEEIQSVIERFPISSLRFRVFVETGTHVGGTIFAMEEHFDELHTIELSESLYEMARERGSEKIQFYHGDSTFVLPGLVYSLTTPTIFWLDGHFCHGNSARGIKDCPLLEEIAAINSFHKPYAIVIIDDVRLFDVIGAEDWSGITEDKILSIVKDRCLNHFSIPSTYDPRDRLVLCLNSK